MMPPTPLSTHAALSLAGPLPAEMPASTPLQGEFAALLGLELKAGAAGADLALAIPDTAAPIVQPGTTDNREGTSLPGEVPVAVDAETPGADVPSETPALLPVTVPTLPVPGAPPAASTAQPPAPLPHREGSVPPPAAQNTGNGPDKTITVQPEPRSEQAPPAIALPRLVAPAPEEAARAASPASTRLALSPIEGSVAPTTTAPLLTVSVVAEPFINPPAATAPTTPRTQAPHEFATLVDRLIEARDTARAVQSPQTVSALLAHADFGNVAIRFEHGAQALSVALSNPDPDFARAVQAAAPAAQAGEGGAAPQRQDGSGQQSAGSSGQSPQSQTQSHSQSSAQPQQRAAGSPTRNAGPHGSGHDQQQPGRSGIFA